jgi:hypothetical protein
MTDMFSSGHMRVPRRALHYMRPDTFLLGKGSGDAKVRANMVIGWFNPSIFAMILIIQSGSEKHPNLGYSMQIYA